MKSRGKLVVFLWIKLALTIHLEVYPWYKFTVMRYCYVAIFYTECGTPPPPMTGDNRTYKFYMLVSVALGYCIR